MHTHTHTLPHTYHTRDHITHTHTHAHNHVYMYMHMERKREAGEGGGMEGGTRDTHTLTHTGRVLVGFGGERDRDGQCSDSQPGFRV